MWDLEGYIGSQKLQLHVFLQIVSEESTSEDHYVLRKA